jgi:hypothetical protein
MKADSLEGLIRSGVVELPTVQPQTSAVAQEELRNALNPAEWPLVRLKEAFLLALRSGSHAREESFGLKPVGLRQRQRWWASYEESKRRLGEGVYGLFRRKPSVSRPSKLPKRSLEIMQMVADELYFTQDRRSPKVCYREVVDRTAAESVHCPSQKTWRIFLRRARNREEEARARISEKAAYQFSFGEGYEENWLTADDAVEKYAHLDARQLKVVGVDSLTGRPLGKPWIIRLFCPCLHAPWAFVVTYDEPSHRHAMLVMRVAYERWGFLPRYISVDKGSEFRHAAFEQLLAVFGVHRVRRPSAQSRFGSAIESSFKRMKVECDNTLRGNTQSTKNVRQITKSSAPEKRAVWTLPALFDHYVEYDKTIWETVAPEIGTSPRDAYSAKKCYTPDIPKVPLPADLAAVIFMSPTPQGMATVQPGRGVCIGGYYYWHESFRSAKIEKTKVETRYDPFDLSHAFARIEGVWQRCLAKHYNKLLHCTEKQQRIATLERRFVRRLYPYVRDKERGSRLLCLHRDAQKSEKLLLQQRRDAEARTINGRQSDEQNTPQKAIPEKWSFGHLRKHDDVAAT